MMLILILPVVMTMADPSTPPEVDHILPVVDTSTSTFNLITQIPVHRGL
jgi:hypothetical protein